MKGRLSDTLPMVLTLIEAQDINLIYVRSINVFHVVPTLIHSRGCGRPENTPLILEELFREDRCLDLGGRCHRSVESRRLLCGITWAVAGRGKLQVLYQGSSDTYKYNRGFPEQVCLYSPTKLT